MSSPKTNANSNITNQQVSIRKFQFFEEIIENAKSITTNINTNNNSQNTINDTSEKTENPPQKTCNISLSSIVLEKDHQIQAMDGVIFASGKIVYEVNKQKQKKYRILKIVSNQVIDEYILFNKYYFDFLIFEFDSRPLMAALGSSLEGMAQNISSIKFYDISPFLENKLSRYPVKKGVTELEENYPSLLKNQIRLLSKKSSNILLCDTEGNKTTGYYSFDDLSVFTLNSSLTICAIATGKGDILLLFGFPNFIDCKGKEIKIILLQHQTGVEPGITNLKLAEFKGKRILYATTKDSIFYYEWSCDEKLTPMEDIENSIEINYLYKNERGADNGCLNVKNNLLTFATSDELIFEYKNLEEVSRLSITGEKKYLQYFNDYILFCSSGKNSNSIQVYDPKNKFFAYYKIDTKKILGVCCDTDYIYAFIEASPIKKYFIKLVEKENKKKFDTFFAKKFFDTAAAYAKYLNFDKKKLSDIYAQYAEYEYSKGNFDKSVDQYIKTINVLDPCLVIQKFLHKSKLEFLIKYLEGIQKNEDFKRKESYKDYTTLLLNCYIMKEEISKLKTFIDKKGGALNKEIVQKVIDVCLETKNQDLALTIAQEQNFHEEYIRILIFKNKTEEALSFITEDKKLLGLEDKVSLFCKFAESFLNKELKGLPEKFYEKVTEFIEKNNSKLTKEEKMGLCEIFFNSDKFFTKVFDKLSEYGLDYSKDMIHRIIELYFEESEKDEKYKKEKLDKIINTLKNPQFLGKYDNQYLMMLFKYKNFPEGIEVLSELNSQMQELLSIYMEKHDYSKIIEICSTEGNTDPSFWGLSLNYFVDKDVRNQLNDEGISKINTSLQDFLERVLLKRSILPANVLDIINEKNDEISLGNIRKFIDDALDEEIDPLDKKIQAFNAYNDELENVKVKIKDLQTKASVYKLNKCEACFMGISFPAVCFRCGHCFHTMCLNANLDDDMNNVECPTCIDEKGKYAQKLEDSKNFFEMINNKESLKQNIEDKSDKEKLEYVHKLYGNGVMVLGPVDEECTDKEVDEAMKGCQE